MKYLIAIACGVGGAVWGRLNGLGPILVVLLVANALDYITGMWASAGKGRLSSEKGNRGIYKKLGLWIGITAAYLMDILLIYGTPAVGVTAFAFPVLCPAVALWMAINEILSVLENLGLLGVPIPDFLKKSILLLQGELEPELEDAIKKAA